jgi:hypothetical protein
MSKLFEVTLTHKEKMILPADSASDAVARAMADVQNRKVTFEPAQWGVKEKVETE